MNGKVYMFNVSAEDMTRIQVRTFPTDDTINGWSTEATSKYAPFALAVERSKFPEDRFTLAQGANSVTFSRPTFNGAFDLTIDPAVSIADDLVLYVTRETALLMRTNGEIIEEVKFPPKLAAEEADLDA